MHSQAGHKLKSAFTYVLMQYLHKSDEFIRKYYSRFIVSSRLNLSLTPMVGGEEVKMKSLYKLYDAYIGNTLGTTLYNSHVTTPPKSTSSHNSLHDKHIRRLCRSTHSDIVKAFITGYQFFNIFFVSVLKRVVRPTLVFVTSVRITSTGPFIETKQ